MRVELTDLPRGILHQDLAGKYRSLSRYEPSPQLRHVISHHWVVEWDLPAGLEYSSKTLDKPGAAIVFQPSGAALYGVQTRLFEYSLCGQGRVFGTKFTPAGGSALCPQPMQQLVNRAIPLASVAGEWDPKLAEQIPEIHDHQRAIGMLEQQLQNLGLDHNREIALADQIVAYIDRTPDACTVGEVAQAFDLHVRTLQTLISKRVGPGVKWIIRRFRVFEALRNLDQGVAIDLAGLAYDLRYSSQSHFASDFKQLTGYSPSAYRQKSRAVSAQ